MPKGTPGTSRRATPGEVIIDAAGEDRLEAAFEMAIVGLLQLQATRPEAIQVEIKE